MDTALHSRRIPRVIAGAVQNQRPAVDQQSEKLVNALTKFLRPHK